MKRILVLLSLAVIMVSCSYNGKWEYKIVTINGESRGDYLPNTFTVTSDDLNLFGIEGWELVDVYTIIETTHPNFGNSEYVTGIRENTKTQSINYVFKRRK